MAVAQDQHAEVLERLKWDWPFWAPHCAKIVNTASQLVALEPKPAQLRIWEAIQAQRDAGLPGRIIVPKARKEGVSTMAVSLAIQRTTLIENHNALIVAQDNDTASELLRMAVMMHANLPDSATWPIKPPIANRTRSKELVFGNPARQAHKTGDFGINSQIQVDTASELESGRGFTRHTLHCSEAAFWRDLKRKLTSLINSVPDEPDTLILLESTANGYGHWRDMCLAAREGRNDYALVFLPWFLEPQYRRKFLSEEERAEFGETVGQGIWGEAEPDLIEMGVDLEQLAWRRWAIENRCGGDINTWLAEYPATLDESFLSSGSTVFNQTYVGRAKREIETMAPAETGVLSATGSRLRRLRHTTIDIPEAPKWRAGKGEYEWRVWEHPQEDLSYVIGVDPAGDDVMHEDDAAMHGVVVIEHKTGRQVAELHAQGDADEIGVQVYLGALYFNRAWVAIETTGGWGLSMARKIFKDYGYPFTYRRKSLMAGRESQEDRLGWDTNRVSKVILEDGGKELLREGTHGLRSDKIVSELTTYIKQPRGGKHGPAEGQRSDLMMAWLIAAQVRVDVNPSMRQSPGVVSTTTRSIRTRKTGY